MKDNLQKAIVEICRACGGDRTRMMDIVEAVQSRFGCVSGEAMELIAKEVHTHRVEVESVVSFYAFLSDKPKGNVVIRLCNDIVDKMHGADIVAAAFEKELGIKFGETTEDGKITLERTPCIGMSDQAPAALVNDKVMTKLSADSARQIARTLKETGDPEKLPQKLGDGRNADPLVRSMVVNNIRARGEVLFSAHEPGVGLKRALGMSPDDVIKEIKASRLRGRGGAGFPIGMKLEFTRGAEGSRKFVLCNADEGEPGTFKDRVLLTEASRLLFEGMAIAGWAIGAETGVLYLRGEYAYLRAYLESVLAEMRAKNLLGANAGGKQGFNFDIRIQMGAGAYVCGEETSLISSCEGLRGDPKTRPPFPAQKGYLGLPSSVNNVETLSCLPRIMEKGAAWFSGIGTEKSAGTKAFSISGDCKNPGVYELPFGATVKELLNKAGGEDAAAVQIGGPSGQMIAPKDFGRKFCFDDLATGGSVMVFGPNRNLLEAAHAFMEFFVDESCGYCTPCRVGNQLLARGLEKILAGHGEPSDLEYLEKLGTTVRLMSRCGLGQTSAQPVLTTLKNFRELYEKQVKARTDGRQPTFDIKAAVSDAEKIAGRACAH